VGGGGSDGPEPMALAPARKAVGWGDQGEVGTDRQTGNRDAQPQRAGRVNPQA